MPRGRGYFGPQPVVAFTAGVPGQVQNATVKLYQQGTGKTSKTTVTDNVYSSPTGLSTLNSAGFAVTDGMLAFYTDRHMFVDIGVTPSGGSEQVTQNVPVGTPDGRKYATDYGAKFDGTTDDSGAINAATATLGVGEPLQFPFGTAAVSAASLVLPYQDGASWVGVGGGGTNRLGGTILKAKSGASLWAIAATQEILTNGSTKDMAQGTEIRGMSFWGGGLGAGSTAGQTGTIEATANTQHCLAVHQSGRKIIDCQMVSANGYGLYLSSTGVDGTDISTDETHETKVDGCVIRYTGLDGIHGDEKFQDGTITGWTKIQYCGRHGVYLQDAEGWSLTNFHPSWCYGDLAHLETCWQTEVTGLYDGSIGRYADGTGYPLTHYGIWAQGPGPILIHHNRFNTNASGGAMQSDPVTPIYLQGSVAGGCDFNSFVYQTGDNVVLPAGDIIEKHSVDAGFPIVSNTSRAV